MSLPRFNRVLLGSFVFLAGCQKKTATAPVVDTPAAPPASVEMVKAAERSKHFTAVSKELELGGTLYGFIDIDGDAARLAVSLRGFLEQIAKNQPQIAPYLQQDYASLFTTLGLTDVVAAGISSVPDGTGFYRNRVFLYTPGERHGLLAALGGKAGPFTRLNLAPADADFFGETEVDMPAAYRALQEAIKKVGGDTAVNAFEDGLKKAGESATFSILDLILGLKGHAAVVGRLADKSMALPVPIPGGVSIPQPSFLLSLDGAGPILEPALIKTGAFKRNKVGEARVYESLQPLPLQGVKPVIVFEGTTVYVATSVEFFSECRDQKSGLAQNNDFKAALALVGNEGNGLGYISPHLFQQLRKIETMNPGLPAEAKATLQSVLANLPKPARALISVRSNLTDGILIRSYWDHSLKQDMAVLSLYNPVSVGVLAAMAIPAFQKVRAASQEKAIQNNLRMLTAAADQYRIEHNGKTPLLSDLVGPDKLIKNLTSVTGEDYNVLRFLRGGTLRVRLPDGRNVEYHP